MGQRYSVIGCVLHVNARGSIYMASLGKAGCPIHHVMLRTLIKYYYYYKAGRASVVERLESVCVKRLEFVGAVRVGVESESCWSDWS